MGSNGIPSERLGQGLGLGFIFLFNGGLLTMGITCFSLFSSIPDSNTTLRRALWRVYILGLMLLNIAFLTAIFVWSYRRVIFLGFDESVVGHSMLLVVDSIGYVILSVTDGFLVWRCYMVYRTLSGSRSKLEALLWIVPLVLCMITFGTGTVSISIQRPRDIMILQLISFGSNILLNLLAPTYLTVRLLIHKRMVLKQYGNEAPVGQYLQTVCILLESAALNLPVAIIGIVGIGNGKYFGWVVQAVSVVIQSFASLLILHQVALGKVVARHHSRIAPHSRH
ncbi:hypothetical protein Ac2012v2_006648 [Leucoagaricus gongylophorus]